jgi:hypothetical protein
MKKEPFIAYDVASNPKISKFNPIVGMEMQISLQGIIELQKETGYLFYDSTLGQAPQILNGEIEVKIVDYSTEEGKQIFNNLNHGKENSKEGK